MGLRDCLQLVAVEEDMYNYAIYATFSRRWILFNRIFISDIIVVNDGLWFCATRMSTANQKKTKLWQVSNHLVNRRGPQYMIVDNYVIKLLT